MAANGTSCHWLAILPGTRSTNKSRASSWIHTHFELGEDIMPDTGKSAIGLDANLAAALGYPIGILAIVCLIMDKENKFVKFHALQAILLYVSLLAIWIALIVISIILGVIGFAASSAGSAGGAL